MRHILDNRDIYIRPLQEAGIRVSLTILGNGDGSGVANLSDEAARAFAQDLRSIVDTYGLDGVDFDDMTFDDVSDDVAEAASEQTADPQAGQQDGESTSK